jgi:multidrug resistance efflux pump
MASGQTQVSSETIEKTKQQIRGLVAEIAQLSKSDLDSDEYFSLLLQKIVQALAAVGGAIWTLGEGKKPQLAYQINLSQKLLEEESDEASQHVKLLEYIIASNAPQLVPPASSFGDERLGANPTRQLLVVHPMGSDNQVEGLIEIFQRADTNPATQKGYLQFLKQMCDLAAEWFKNRKLRQFSDRHTLWAQADQFSRAVHQSLDVRETCYTVVNEGRRLMGCDRVTVAILKGGKCKIEAVSGQDTLDTRSNVVTLLGKLATRVVKSGEPLWYAGSTEDLPPQIEQAIEEYVDQSYTKSLAVVPLRKPRAADATQQTSVAQTEAEQAHQGPIVGALIVEQIESEIPRELLAPRLDMVYEHSTRAISNALEHHNLFLMPVWRTIGKSRVVVQGRNLPKTVLISAAVLVLLAIGLLWQTDFDMRAKGTLQPVNKADIFAPMSSEVLQVLKDNGDFVEENEPLVKLRNRDLEIRLHQVEGDFNSAMETAAAVQQQLINSAQKLTGQEKTKLQGELASAKVKLNTLTLQLELIRKQQEQLTVRSPIKGKVISWDVRKTLQNRPVETGQVLMTVAAENTDYHVELYMPERKMKHLANAREAVKRRNADADLEVVYILMTDPGVYHYGKLDRVHGAAEAHEEHGNMVRLHVKPDEPIPNPRPGATLTADVHCGKAPLLWNWLHEAWEYFESSPVMF